MTEDGGTDLGRNPPIGAASRADSTFSASIPGISQSPSTRLLRAPKSLSDDVEIGKRSGHFQSVQVLRQTPVADFAEAKDILGIL
jgi:hypothetical protein